MAENNKLYITISDERGKGGGTPIPTPEPKPKQEEEKDGLLRRYVEHEAFHLLKQQVSQGVNFALGNIGNFTGNYLVQRDVNNAKQFVSDLLSIGTLTLAGAKFGLPGAAVGFAVGVISNASSKVYQAIETSVETQKQNYAIEQLQNRSGLNTTKDGSRGTEN